MMNCCANQNAFQSTSKVCVFIYRSMLSHRRAFDDRTMIEMSSANEDLPAKQRHIRNATLKRYITCDNTAAETLALSCRNHIYIYSQ